jgi:prepilin-type processing-associated H-X9-DG protein
MYKQIKKVSEFRFPSPAEVAVFIDEHPDSMNDPIFWSPNSAVNFPDFPANYHDGAAVIAFADGHTEEHKWIGSMTTGQVTRVNYNARNNYGVSAGDSDLSWMSYHTPRVSSLSY